MNPIRGTGGGASNHLPIFIGKHDRWCVYCGGLIPRQNQQKSVNCPHSGCKRALPLRGGTWIQRNNTGMGRCPVCDSFVHRTFLYCQVCRNANEEGLTRRNESNERALREERESNKRLKMEVEILKKQRDQFMDIDTSSEKGGGVNAKGQSTSSAGCCIPSTSACIGNPSASDGSIQSDTSLSGQNAAVPISQESFVALVGVTEDDLRDPDDEEEAL